MAQGQPELCNAIRSFPGFGHIVQTQQLVLERVAQQLAVQPSRTRHTGDDGVLLLNSLQPGKSSVYFRSYRAPHVPVMTQAFSTFEATPGVRRTYSKTGICTAADALTPHLDIEIGGNDKEISFYAGLSHKLSLASHLDYLDRYYNTTPPAAAPTRSSQPGFAAGAATGGSGGSSSSGSQLPSFKELEAEAACTPGYSRFVSPSLWVRAMCAGALAFRVRIDGAAGHAEHEALAAVRRHSLCLTDIWLAHMAHDTSPEAAGAEAAELSPALLAELRHASRTLLNYVRHDPLTPLLLPVFGEAGVDAWIETMAGEQ